MKNSIFFCLFTASKNVAYCTFTWHFQCRICTCSGVFLQCGISTFTEVMGLNTSSTTGYILKKRTFFIYRFQRLQRNLLCLSLHIKLYKIRHVPLNCAVQSLMIISWIWWYIVIKCMWHWQGKCVFQVAQIESNKNVN